jgi:hypothetical protein
VERIARFHFSTRHYSAIPSLHRFPADVGRSLTRAGQFEDVQVKIKV